MKRKMSRRRNNNDEEEIDLVEDEAVVVETVGEEEEDEIREGGVDDDGSATELFNATDADQDEAEAETAPAAAVGNAKEEGKRAVETGGRDGASASASASVTDATQDDNDDDSYEEECVICLEPLSAQDWGRCTPCNHAFHKQCWFEWENAHNARIDRQVQRGINNANNDEGPKCCLCNTVNKQFVDGIKGKAEHNPSPYVATEDPGDAGGNRFSNFFREATAEAGGFMEFLQSEFREQWGESMPPFPRRNGRNNNNRSNDDNNNANRRRSSSNARRNRSVPPFFGSRSNNNDNNDDRSSSNNANATNTNRDGSTNSPFDAFRTFEVPPFLRTQTSPREAGYNSGTVPNNGNLFKLIRPGTKIITQNLVNSPHLNGRRGSVLRYQTTTGRYLVQLESDISTYIATGGDGTTSPVAMKPENLLQCPKVKLRNLRSQPELNGKEGTVAGYSRQRNRYVVRVESSLFSASPARELSIRASNIRMPNGACVRLEGLQRTPQWNGKYGTIVGFVEGNEGSPGRYEVCLSRQYAVRVKMENVRL